MSLTEITAIMLNALERHDFESFVDAITCGADINAFDEVEGVTLCSLATKHIKYLTVALSHGANPNLHNKNGTTALTYAIESCRYQIIPVLLEYGAKFEYEKPTNGETSLHLVSERGEYFLVKLICDCVSKEYLNRFGLCSYTPIMKAVQCNHIDCVKLLLDSGADINAHDADRDGSTALHIACTFSTPEMVKLLLDRGADKTIPGWMQLLPEHKIPKGKEGAEMRKLFGENQRCQESNP